MLLERQLVLDVTRSAQLLHSRCSRLHSRCSRLGSAQRALVHSVFKIKVARNLATMTKQPVADVLQATKAAPGQQILV
jgi:hypothetical protein